MTTRFNIQIRSNKTNRIIYSKEVKDRKMKNSCNLTVKIAKKLKMKMKMNSSSNMTKRVIKLMIRRNSKGSNSNRVIKTNSNRAKRVWLTGKMDRRYNTTKHQRMKSLKTKTTRPKKYKKKIKPRRNQHRKRPLLLNRKSKIQTKRTTNHKSRTIPMALSHPTRSHTTKWVKQSWRQTRLR